MTQTSPGAFSWTTTEKPKVVAKAAVVPKHVKGKATKAPVLAPPPPPPQVIQRGDGKRGGKRPRTREDE